MALVAFKNPLAVAGNTFRPSELTFAHDQDGIPVLVDEVLGLALGYADPMGAIRCLYAEHADELGGYTALADIQATSDSGRPRVRVFYLEGALRLCRLARTPAAVRLFGFLKGIEAHNAVIDFEEELLAVPPAPPAGNVVPFPLHHRRAG